MADHDSSTQETDPATPGQGSRTHPAAPDWVAYVVPVVLACGLGWGLQQRVEVPYLLLIAAILALSCAAAILVLTRGADRREGSNRVSDAPSTGGTEQDSPPL